MTSESIYHVIMAYIGKINKKLAAEFAEMAENKGITSSQLALAWLLAQSENIIPIPGTKRIKYLEENAEAANVNLSTEDVSNIELLLKKYPNIGNRYNEHYFKFVNK